nr:serine/threonine protein kinase [Acidobacteriota bacterium]
MSTLTGTRLGPYDVISALGAGGMGEVYRARDSRLDRDVAIKILPPAFAGDGDRLARFEREAKTLASLNHPNIAQIYGIEEVPPTSSTGRTSAALVMELVPGEDLSARISRGPVPLAEALPIAQQIADALEAAHERGIIHRDLKPANVKVTTDGVVKVLDFGLAKAMTRADEDVNPANSPTIAFTGTQAGLIL